MTLSASGAWGLSPGFAQVIEAAIRRALLELHVGMPARVESFDESSGTASVTPLFLRVVLDEDGAQLEEPYETLQDVPVLWPGGHGWAITYSLEVGDQVWVTFSERAMDRWKSSEKGEAVDPAFDRHHDLSDAVLIPAQVRQRARPVSLSGLGDSLRIGRDDGSDPAIVLRANGDIEIGEGAVEKLLLGNTLVSALDSLKEALANHTHPTTSSGSPTGPPLQASSISSPDFASALSERGKVK